MGIRRQIRAFHGVSLLVVFSLLVSRPPMSLIGGIGRFTLFLVIGSLLLFVVSGSTDICRTVVARYRASGIFLFAVVQEEEPPQQILVDDFNPAEPVLPSRFQLPPPQIAA